VFSATRKEEGLIKWMRRGFFRLSAMNEVCLFKGSLQEPLQQKVS
jgi:hypothetical protein